MILVVGGSGRLGRLLVSELAAAGESVRVLTRDPARAAGMPVETVVGDLGDTASLAAATHGCRVVVSAAQGMTGGRGAGPAEVDRDGNRNLIAAAKDADVEHVVLLSVQNAAATHPMELHRMKYAAEQEIRASGIGHTIVRAPAYYETWVEIIGAKLAGGGAAVVFGRGRNPLNFVSVRDVADVVVAAISDPSMRNKQVDVRGPENLTMTELATRLSTRARGASRVRHIPLPALRAMSVLARPVAPTFARMAASAVAMDTAEMTPLPPAADALTRTTRRTLQDVLAADGATSRF